MRPQQPGRDARRMTTATDATTRNLETTGQLYARFGQGDVAGILDLLSDDVAWEVWADNHAQRPGGPDYLRPRRGRVGVGEFFASVAEQTVLDFQVEDVVAGPTHAVAKVTIEMVTKTGGRVRDEELHLLTFDEAGQVVAFRHYVDTAKHRAAWAGEDTR